MLMDGQTKLKHHQNSDTKTANRDHIRTTAFERLVMNYWGGGGGGGGGGGAYTSFTGPTSPSVTDVVQTFNWLFGLQGNTFFSYYSPALKKWGLYWICPVFP